MNGVSGDTALRIAARNYGTVFLFVLVVVALSTFLGDEANLVALKVLVVPLWWLAVRGVDALYRPPIVEPRWTVRSVENALLHAFLITVFVTIVSWTPALRLSELLTRFTVMMALMGAFRLYELRGQIARTRREGVAGG